MTILVTGAAGFVGAHVVRALTAAGGNVVAADITQPEERVRRFWRDLRITSRLLNVADQADVRALLEQVRPTHVVNAAALTPTLDEERIDSARIVAVNIGGTANVLEAAARIGTVRRIVAFSSAAVYGVNASRDPLIETTQPAPATLYGITKVTVEAIARRMSALTGLSIVAIRVAAVYGPMERPTASRARMSPLYRLAEALHARRRIRVSGPDLQRDFVHGDDVGQAVSRLLSANRLNHDIYNVSAGKPVGWHAVVELFRARGLDASWVESGADIEFTRAEARAPLDISRLVADTGFRPEFDLAAGIDDLLAAGSSEAA
jgi:nucleoside-diphosphate-sugar epimerase